MDKLEEIQIKIKKQEDGLLSLEDDYRTAKKKIEESYENLYDNRSQLTRLYEEFENIAYDFGRQNSGDESARHQFLILLESYSVETRSEYLRQYAKIEAKDEELQTQYRKERSRLEKELEESYSQRKDLYELERRQKKC
ncbi:hypothetical protein D8844_03850 [Streptococcus oralis]|uniref:Flagellar FliJ protein n=2 Tax=Streptococcus oralis TaxID=1303 RepID=A0A3R9TVW6_STROR|nr:MULTISPECIES: hypothetical protein [Streptococcus]OFL50689.1 hypothetical protein HMPREF2766_05395 [Streptococcus sp. HMSC076C08]OFP33058.1 hypothetical protein HMPREF2991_07945 [Streptococcus sp. HMSC072D07]RSK17973.1 hypothetical protein D8844_03850 [Streptococcus oralis]